MDYLYNHTTVSGTFDHFHIGHQQIIDLAFNLSGKISVGIASNKMTQQKVLSSEIEPYEKRKKAVQAYIKKKYSQHSVIFFELNNIEGIALKDKSLDSIVVTRETYTNALMINKKRLALVFEPLKIVKVPFLKDTSGKIIRSTRIRQGEINRYGALYKENFQQKKILKMPEKLRPLLREPLGEVITGSEDSKDETAQKVVSILKKEKPVLIITVGDVVTDLLHKNGVKIDLGIIDLHTQRGKVRYEDRGSRKRKIKKFMNKSGTISSIVAKNTYQIFKKGLKYKKNEIMIIRGEEDLIALPAIVLAPLGSVIVYGQLGLGVVLTKVTEEVKAKVNSILTQFE